MLPFIVLVLFVSSAFAQDQFKCPHEYGFYPHHRACDKYWKCDTGVAELKTCGNGLAFDASDPKFLLENCDYLHNVDCGERSQLEPPISTPNCPRLYGIFPDEERCDVFWSCWDGESSRYTCSPGLAYDRDARVCMWADQVPECRQEAAGGFTCPSITEASSGTFTRHIHPEDCRKYYICLGGQPREYGCPIGTVFKSGDDDFSGTCADPEEVPGCEDYYGDLDIKSLKKSELLQGIGGDNSPRSPFQGEKKPTVLLRSKQSQRPSQQASQQSAPPQQSVPARAISQPSRPSIQPAQAAPRPVSQPARPQPVRPQPQASPSTPPPSPRPTFVRTDRPAPPPAQPAPSTQSRPSAASTPSRAGEPVGKTTESNLDEYYYYDDAQ